MELVHARAASPGSPQNIFSTHPIEVVTRDGYKLYIIHNGPVDKMRLLKVLNINPHSLYATIHKIHIF